MDRENEETEFKSELTKETAKTIVAFSNCKGGNVIIGVDDSGKIIGIKDVDETSIKASQMVRDDIRPDIRENVSISNNDFEGKEIICINVKEGALKPYYLREKGLRSEGVFIRSGPVTVNATEDIIRKMIRERDPYESMVSKEQNLTFESTSRILKEMRIEFDKSHMRTMGLYKSDAFTNLAYLLSDQCKQGIKIAVYADNSKTKFIDRCEIDGSVLEQAEKAYDFIEKYNPLRTIVKHGLRRRDFRAYPEPAFREAIINAVAHREYSINGPILISIVENEMTITSLGGLNPDIGVDDLMMGISSPRNPNLCSLLYRMKYIESFGTGIPTIFLEYVRNVIKPRIKITTNVFSITLPNMSGDEDMTQEGRKIIDLISSKGEITRNDVENELKVSKSKATNVLNELVEYGFINIDGNGKCTRYVMSRSIKDKDK